MSEPDARAGREGHGDRLIAELREAVQAREELLDIAAHELRNPLTALLVQVEDALREHGGAIVYDSCNPYHRVWEMLGDPAKGARVTVSGS